MKTLTVALPGREYDILMERGLLSRAGESIRAVLPKAGKAALVSDSNVAPLYARTVLDSLAAAGFEAKLFTIPAGESSKCAARLEELWEGFMAFGLTRSDAVIALGGGVVGDLTGFAAATTLRGVAFIQIPTTLLSACDASVGGKTAVDLPEGKNLAGAFHQPRLVICDTDAFDTLPSAVFTEGMAEVIKHALIADGAFFRFLAEEDIRTNTASIVARNMEIKAAVVADDEREHGRRKILNFGHTLGHAIEKLSGYSVSHGEAVAAGMVLAARGAEHLGPRRNAGRCSLSSHPLLPAHHLSLLR